MAKRRFQKRLFDTSFNKGTRKFTFDVSQYTQDLTASMIPDDPGVDQKVNDQLYGQDYQMESDGRGNFFTINGRRYDVHGNTMNGHFITIGGNEYRLQGRTVRVRGSVEEQAFQADTPKGQILIDGQTYDIQGDGDGYFIDVNGRRITVTADDNGNATLADHHEHGGHQHGQPSDRDRGILNYQVIPPGGSPEFPGEDDQGTGTEEGEARYGVGTPEGDVNTRDADSKIRDDSGGGEGGGDVVDDGKGSDPAGDPDPETETETDPVPDPAAQEFFQEYGYDPATGLFGIWYKTATERGVRHEPLELSDFMALLNSGQLNHLLAAFRQAVNVTIDGKTYLKNMTPDSTYTHPSEGGTPGGDYSVPYQANGQWLSYSRSQDQFRVWNEEGGYWQTITASPGNEIEGPPDPVVAPPIPDAVRTGGGVPPDPVTPQPVPGAPNIPDAFPDISGLTQVGNQAPPGLNAQNQSNARLDWARKVVAREIRVSPAERARAGGIVRAAERGGGRATPIAQTGIAGVTYSPDQNGVMRPRWTDPSGTTWTFSPSKNQWGTVITGPGGRRSTFFNDDSQLPEPVPSATGAQGGFAS